LDPCRRRLHMQVVHRKQVPDFRRWQSQVRYRVEQREVQGPSHDWRLQQQPGQLTHLLLRTELRQVIHRRHPQSFPPAGVAGDDGQPSDGDSRVGVPHVWLTPKILQLGLAARGSFSDNGRMQQAKYSTYELRVRAVRALHEGMPVAQVAQAYQVDRTTLYRWRVRFDQASGPQSLVRLPGRGRPRTPQDVAPPRVRAAGPDHTPAFC